MNVLQSTWRQLVRRKLWPVALLLVAALAAVPVLLTRDAETPLAPADAVPATTEAGDSIAEPIVAKVTAEDRTKRRRVLGSRKDPFEPAPAKKSKSDKPKEAKAQEADDAEKADETPSSTDGGTSGGGVVPTPVDTEPAPEKVYFEAGTIIVRFGEAKDGVKLTRMAVKKGEPLPDDAYPLLVYMGLTKDGKKARFLVDASIEADGDGDCKPHPSVCETILLGSGETEFLDVVDPEWDEDDEESTEENRILASFQLDVVDIKRAGDDDVK
jgi:hypothetical protein